MLARLRQIAASIIALASSFVGPSPGTSAGSVNGSDIFRSAVVSGALFAGITALHLMPATSALAPAVLFGVELVRRLPHQAVPGEEDLPEAPGTTAALGLATLEDVADHLRASGWAVVSPLVPQSVQTAAARAAPAFRGLREGIDKFGVLAPEADDDPPHHQVVS